MAGASLLTLLDDIAAVLDDVSLMTKVAAKKTAGVLGDDLALNAQQVTGVNADTSSSPRKSSPSPWVPSPSPASPPRYWCWSASPW